MVVPSSSNRGSGGGGVTMKSVRDACFWYCLGVLSTLTIFVQLSAFDVRTSSENLLTTTPTVTDGDTTSTKLIRKQQVDTNAVSTTRQHQMKQRQEKYKYVPPSSRSNDEFQLNVTAICGTKETNFDLFWTLPYTERSRANEDKMIYDIFFRHTAPSDRTPQSTFHYVELGAFDGKTESNTRFFDICLGWTGLLIEPNPNIYPLLVNNRPYSHRMSYAASCIEKDGIPSDETIKFFAGWFTNAAEDASPNRAGLLPHTEVVVPCGSLQPVLLDSFPITKRIQFFSLDVEGVELAILKTIDFNSIFIDVLIAENENGFCQEKCEARDQVRDYMQNINGYILYKTAIRFSDLYVHPKSEYATYIQQYVK